jgi:hypothetical protein
MKTTYSIMVILFGLLTLASPAVNAGTPPFDVIRSDTAASMSSAAPYDSVSSGTYDDDNGTLADGQTYFYMVRDALSQGLTIFVQKNSVTQSVRLSFNGDPTNTPIDPDTEFQVNATIAGKQEKPVVGQAADGGLVVIWQGEDSDNKGIFGRIFNADGTPVGADFPVNTTTIGKQESPAVDVAPDGSFVVVWQSPDFDDKGIFAQMFLADGTPLGTEFRVNATETGKQDKPRVAVAGDGRFVVIWQAEDLDDRGVFGQAFNAIGQPVGPEFRANTIEIGKQDQPDLALAPDGSFIVVWKSPDADGYGVFGQRFDMNGLPVGTEFQANSLWTGKQGEPRAAVSASGQFMIVWRADIAGEKDVYARRYDASGVPLGVEFVVNSITSGKQDKPDVAMADDGRSMVVWKSDDLNKHISGQLFDAMGNPSGGELQFSEPGTVSADRPSVSFAPNAASFVVVWQAEDGDGKGVFGRWVPVP